MSLKGKTLYAYVAGIIDGDGHIGIYRINTAKQKRFAIRVTVGTTSEWLSQFLQFHFGGSTHISPRPEHKSIWFWAVSAKKAEQVIELLLPYLQLKRPQAELALSFQHRKHPRHTPLPDAERALEETDRILMHKYNGLYGRPKEMKEMKEVK